MSGQSYLYHSGRWADRRGHLGSFADSLVEVGCKEDLSGLVDHLHWGSLERVGRTLQVVLLLNYNSCRPHHHEGLP